MDTGCKTGIPVHHQACTFSRRNATTCFPKIVEGRDVIPSWLTVGESVCLPITDGIVVAVIVDDNDGLLVTATGGALGATVGE